VAGDGAIDLSSRAPRSPACTCSAAAFRHYRRVDLRFRLSCGWPDRLRAELTVPAAVSLPR
jgi:hypothetical protein